MTSGPSAANQPGEHEGLPKFYTYRYPFGARFEELDAQLRETLCGVAPLPVSVTVTREQIALSRVKYRMAHAERGDLGAIEIVGYASHCGFRDCEPERTPMRDYTQAEAAAIMGTNDGERRAALVAAYYAHATYLQDAEYRERLVLHDRIVSAAAERIGFEELKEELDAEIEDPTGPDYPIRVVRSTQVEEPVTEIAAHLKLLSLELLSQGNRSGWQASNGEELWLGLEEAPNWEGGESPPGKRAWHVTIQNEERPPMSIYPAGLSQEEIEQRDDAERATWRRSKSATITAVELATGTQLDFLDGYMFQSWTGLSGPPFLPASQIGRSLIEFADFLLMRIKQRPAPTQADIDAKFPTTSPADPPQQEGGDRESQVALRAKVAQLEGRLAAVSRESAERRLKIADLEAQLKAARQKQ